MTVGNWGETMNKIHVRSEINKSSNQTTKLGKHGNIFKAHVKFTCFSVCLNAMRPTYYKLQRNRGGHEQSDVLHKYLLYTTLEDKLDINTSKSPQKFLHVTADLKSRNIKKVYYQQTAIIHK
jgi:hypothetical protein